jgi:hypothetical protein
MCLHYEPRQMATRNTTRVQRHGVFTFGEAPFRIMPYVHDGSAVTALHILYLVPIPCLGLSHVRVFIHRDGDDLLLDMDVLDKAASVSLNKQT